MSTETMPLEPSSYGAIISRNIVAARARTRPRMNQSDLAARMKKLGYGWYPQTVGVVERGQRRVEVAELLGLALALETTIGNLLDPGPDDRLVELPAGQELPSSLVSSLVRFVRDEGIRWEGDTLVFGGPGPWAMEDPERRPTMEMAKPLIVAAIVTSSNGVLIGRRNDRMPPWTFIAGEQEPGEQPEDTVVREVKEETGIEIIPGGVLATRVHPRTGRTLLYMTGIPAGEKDPVVGDEAELAEVRWADLGTVLALLPDMFEPVREHLTRVLGAR